MQEICIIRTTKVLTDCVNYCHSEIFIEILPYIQVSHLYSKELYLIMNVQIIRNTQNLPSR